MDKKQEDLKRIANKSPIALLAESIKKGLGIAIAVTVSEVQDGIAERNAAMEKIKAGNKKTAETLSRLITEGAKDNHAKLLSIDSFNTHNFASETPMPLLEHLFTKGLKEENGEILLFAETVLVRMEDIQAIDGALLNPETMDQPNLLAMLIAASDGKIPFEYARLIGNQCAIRMGRIAG